MVRSGLLRRTRCVNAVTGRTPNRASCALGNRSEDRDFPAFADERLDETDDPKRKERVIDERADSPPEPQTIA